MADMPTAAKKYPRDRKSPAPKSAGSSARKTAPARERVLIEFPVSLLERADRAAAAQSRNRSEFIRDAVEQAIDAIHRKQVEEELAAAYRANDRLSLTLAEEFAHVDCEGFE